jgi:hypothetical protein
VINLEKKTMKTKLASVLGLAVLVASFICGGSLVYAQTAETSSVMQAVAPVGDANGAESEVSCILDSAGADICTVTAKLAEVDEPSDIGAQETLSVMQAAASAADADGAESDVSCILDAAGADICTVTVKLAEVGEPLDTAPAVEAADAIVVEVSQSVTVAAPGQEARDNEEPAQTGSISEPPAQEPVSTASTND